MGFLYYFNLGQIIQQYGTLAFVETGTGLGFGVYHASQFPFQTIISIDIVPDELKRIAPEFGHDKRIHLVLGKSIDGLREVLPQINVPICFWLDAHYPGSYQHKPYDNEQDERIRLPLEHELRLIKELRPEGRDVILIDDLRIYERDQFEWGNMEQVGLGGMAKLDSSFLYKIFEQTHTAHRYLAATGYFALLPKPRSVGLQSPP